MLEMAAITLAFIAAGAATLFIVFAVISIAERTATAISERVEFSRSIRRFEQRRRERRRERQSSRR